MIRVLTCLRIVYLITLSDSICLILYYPILLASSVCMSVCVFPRVCVLQSDTC